MGDANHNGSIDLSKPFETEGYVCTEPVRIFYNQSDFTRQLPSHDHYLPIWHKRTNITQCAKLTLEKVTLPPLNATSVQVDIKLVGLCHTDILMKDNEWGNADFPLLAGHEGVGEVTHIGSSVRSIQVGDHVGIGWIRDSCRTCPRCQEGRDNVCRNGFKGTYLGKTAGPWGKESYNEHGGCFARVQRIEERFAVKLPKNLPMQLSATLLCAGATVYEPLVKFGFVGARVGVMGIGGLGRWAVKLAKLRACTVVAISTSEEKKDLIMDAGADEFWIADDTEEVRDKLDLIVDTRPVNSALDGPLGMLALDGTYCRVGIPNKEKQTFEGQWIPTIFKEHSIAGTCVTGPRNMADMMKLCGANADFVQKGEESFAAEIISMHDINDGIERLNKGENEGYRYVLKW